MRQPGVDRGVVPSGVRQGALSHIRICDFTGQLAGAGATRILATFGAQVIRIEDNVTQGRWDIMRGNAPFARGRRSINTGASFNNHNVEKLGITLNMRHPKSKALLRQLVAVSDVVTENFSTGVLARWGFSYDDLLKVNPSVIYVSNNGFGHWGPYARFKTWGPTVQAISGLTHLAGLADQPPAGWGYSYMDHTGAYFMAMAILMAIHYREITGQGQQVELATAEAATTLCGPVLLDFAINGRRARRPGYPNSNRSDHPAMAPHGIYRCKGEDQWVAISVRNDADWHAFYHVLGNPDWASAPRFCSLVGRLEHQDDLDRLVEDWTCSRSPYEVMEALQQRGVPAAAVQRPGDRIERDPNVQDWGLFPEVEHKEMGRVRVDGMPARLSATPANIAQGGPCLGQDNDFIYGDLLGFSPEEIAALREEGVV